MVEATSYLSNIYLSEEQGLFQPIESLRQKRGTKPIHSKKKKKQKQLSAPQAPNCPTGLVITDNS